MVSEDGFCVFVFVFNIYSGLPYIFHPNSLRRHWRITDCSGDAYSKFRVIGPAQSDPNPRCYFKVNFLNANYAEINYDRLNIIYTEMQYSIHILEPI